MCNFCEEATPIQEADLESTLTIKKLADDSSILIYSNDMDDNQAFEINYCLKCGKKLK